MGQGKEGRSAEAEIARTEPRERDPVGSNDIGVERFCGGNQPGIVLTQAPRRATLHQGTASCLRQMQSLNGESLQ